MSQPFFSLQRTAKPATAHEQEEDYQPFRPQSQEQRPYAPEPPPAYREPEVYRQREAQIVTPAHAESPHGFAQTFGLHPAMALLTVIVNTMVFASGFGTGGIGWLTSIPVGLVIGVIIFLGQKKWYGDDNENALIKALIVAFLTAIPTSLPGYLTIPSGIVGLFHRNKN